MTAFRQMMLSGATVYHNDAGAIIFERYIADDVARCWLFFDKFSRKTYSMIRDATDSFHGRCMLAYTDDSRMLKLLQRTRFTVIDKVGDDYVLLKRGLM